MPEGHRPTLKPGRVSGPPPAPPAADTTAIAAAAEALIAQVRRIADALEPTVVAHAVEEQPAPAHVPHDELWSLLDWTFWGAGMGDVLREGMADAMVTAITPEQRADALRVMAAWHASGREPIGRRAYEELKAERDKLRLERDTLRGWLDGDRLQVIDEMVSYHASLTDQLTAAEGERDAAHTRADGYASDIDRLRAEIQTADRIRAEAQRDRDQHAAVLGEVLATFVHETHPGRRCLQSGHINVGTVERWRSVVAPTVERPWWEQLAEERSRADTAEMRAERRARTVARIRRLADRTDQGQWINPFALRFILDTPEPEPDAADEPATEPSPVDTYADPNLIGPADRTG
jgi:hypothetical protein